MSYVVQAYEPGRINLAPKTVNEEVLQNINMIISTPKFSVPLDRDFGLAQKFVDKPLQIAQTMIVSEVMDAIEKYEPRAEVLSVEFELGESAGKMIPKVEVNIIE